MYMAQTALPVEHESGDATVNVLVVDDQRSFRAAAAAVIELTDRFALVGEAEGATDAQAVLGTEPVDLVLMDINLRDESGIDVTASLLHDHPQLRVILRHRPPARSGHMRGDALRPQGTAQPSRTHRGVGRARLDGRAVKPETSFDDPHEEDAAGRLRRAILVDEVAAALGAVAIALLYLGVVRNLWLLSLMIPVGGLAVALRFARREIDRGNPSRAVTIHAVGNWVVGVSVTFVVPFIWPILMLTVLMPLVLAVPHVRRRHLVTLIATSVGIVVAVSLLGLTQMATGITDDVSPWIRNTVVISALAAVFIIIVVIVWQAHSQNEAILLQVMATNADLARSEEELAHQAVLLRDSRARLASVADQERRRIERDLHDGAQQRLVGLAVRLGLLSTQLDESHAATVDTMRDEINSAIEELRELAHGIYPPQLAREGLAVALRAAARRSPLPTRISADQLDRYAPDIENALYFCCLEALQNAAKHAGDAASIVIDLQGSRTTVELRVTDDGRGFQSAEVDSGSGLLNMKDRVGAVGGTVEIGPLDGGGVEVRATVPATARSSS